ncbi:hypothetical protein ACFFQW_40635 [Umezawaea endophytica]|uniref:Uncharacterized protein n=1 Tax=Umezawaea endophytica TaxID=1654476 RepID=A0A9X3AEN9_9PSEU|nr:hypothetical protein [Umezawaea endophytica]MCS7477106.1 hypothetical protein [Umezawaea endophytica]
MTRVTDDMVLAVRITDLAERRKWFEALVTRFAQAEGDQGRLTALLTEDEDRREFPPDTVRAFVESLERANLRPVEVVGEMVALTADELLDLYAQAEARVAAAHQPAVPVVRGDWATFLAEHGPRWNGAHADWDVFRTWFLHAAGLVGLAAEATGFLTLADQDGRHKTFRAYQVTVPHDQEDWNRFLAANGVRWNGQPRDWAVFRTWFEYTADQEALASPAKAFLDHAEAGGQRAVFAQYHITLPPLVETPPPVPRQEPEPVAEAPVSLLDRQLTDDEVASAERALAEIDREDDDTVLLTADDFRPDDLLDLLAVQEALSLKVDGVVGPVTIQAIDDYIAAHDLVVPA